MSDNDLIRRGDVRELLQQCDLMGNHPSDPLAVMFNEIPAVQPIVKPLDWDQLEGLPDYDIWEALTALGRYKVQQASWNDYALLVRPNGSIGQFPTIEAAKAAAQADYEARILPALDMQPTVSPNQVQPDDVAALVDAVNILLVGKAIAVRQTTKSDIKGATK